MILSSSSFNWRCWDSFAFLASLPEPLMFPPTWLILTQLQLQPPRCSIPTDTETLYSFFPLTRLSIYMNHWFFSVFLFFVSQSYLHIGVLTEKSRHPRRRWCPSRCSAELCALMHIQPLLPSVLSAVHGCHHICDTHEAMRLGSHLSQCLTYDHTLYLWNEYICKWLIWLDSGIE